MGYAALGVAVLAFLGILLAASRRHRRWWVEKPVWRAYRETVTDLGLSMQEQQRLERATRRGRPVPPAQAPAAIAFAETVLTAQQDRPRWQRGVEVLAGVFVVVGAVLIAVDAASEPFAWSRTWPVLNSMVVAALTLLRPHLEERGRRRLRRSLALAREQADRPVS